MQNRARRGFLNSYVPLVATRAGREAARRFELPPFADFSCRRTPDFEHPMPAITGLCRPGFVGRLRPGDIVAYIAAKGRYGEAEPHWRLVAVLQVKACLPSHAAAAEWYRSAGLPLPRDILVPGNPPLLFDRTGGVRGPYRRRIGTSVRMWDALYQDRARRSPVVAATRPLYRELRRPPTITEDMMRRAFGRIPWTRTPPRIPIQKIMRLAEACGVGLRPFG